MKFNFLFSFFVAFFVAAFCPIQNAVSEILIHFYLQYFLCAVIFFCIFCISRKWKSAGLSFLIMVYSASFLSPLFISPMVDKTDAFEDITAFQFNVNYRHPNIKHVLHWINDLNKTEVSPDIIIIQEATDEIINGLNDLSVHYPYKILNPKLGQFGMALYSRLPIQRHEKARIGRTGNEYTMATFLTPNKKISFSLVELHAMNPLVENGIEEQRLELKNIADVISRLPTKHKILLGDFNMTPYSIVFKNLEMMSGLRNAMQGTNFYGTFPTFLPIPFRIPIDHVLVSKNIAVLERKVCEDLGSDHFPVMIRLRIYG